jgi:hypothetical protein
MPLPLRETERDLPFSRIADDGPCTYAVVQTDSGIRPYHRLPDSSWKTA